MFTIIKRHSQRFLVRAVFSAILLSVAVVWATPASGILFNIILSTVIASGDLDVKVHADGWKVSLETKGESDFYMQDIAIVPVGYSGWHTHPGIFVGTVITRPGKSGPRLPSFLQSPTTEPWIFADSSST